MYLYKTRIIKDTSQYTVIAAGLASAHASAKSDFEANHKATSNEISERILNDTVSVLDMSYTDFDTLVATPVSWADVQYTSVSNHYEICLLTTVVL